MSGGNSSSVTKKKDELLEEELFSEQTFEEICLYGEQKAEEIAKLKSESYKKLNRAREKRIQSIKERQPRSKDMSEYVENDQPKDAKNYVPVNVNALALVEARTDEIEMCERAASSLPEKMALSQRLPVWMRRRAMSKQPKRVPSFARPHSQSSTVKAANSKRFKYKKHRKRRLPKNLDFLNRQKNCRWLESHVWHAKRFQMIEKWGYKIANFCNDKILRALHRDVKIKCAMCDTSYYGWVQLEGPQNVMLLALRQITSPDLGLTFAANEFLSGLKEGTVVLYYPDRYPLGCIGPVDFIWKPVPSVSAKTLTHNKFEVSVQRTLWINYHPAMKFPLLTALKLIVETSPQISFKNLERELNSIELIGSDSLAFLKKCLQYSNVDLQYKEKLILNKAQTKVVKMKKSFWWSKIYDTNSAKSEIRINSCKWESLKTSDVAPGQVIGFLSRDPRLAFRQKPDSLNSSEGTPSTIDSTVLGPYSYIWDDEVRDYVMTRKMTNKQTENYLTNYIPMAHVDIFDEEARIPLLLIRKDLPTCNANGLISSLHDNMYRTMWKLVVPRNWMIPFWLVFKRLKLRVYGLRERRRFLKRAGLLTFPNEFVDSVVGRFCLLQEIRNEYLTMRRKPPSKRFHFERFGFDNPFSCNFEKLLGVKSESSFIELTNELLPQENVLNPVVDYQRIKSKQTIRSNVDSEQSSKNSDGDSKKRKLEDETKESSNEQPAPKKEKLDKNCAQYNVPVKPKLEVEIEGTKTYVDQSSLPLNYPDLSECITLPALKTFPIPEQSMSLKKLLKYQPKFLKHQIDYSYYVLRDRSLLCELQAMLKSIEPSKKTPEQPRVNNSAFKSLLAQFDRHLSNGLVMIQLKSASKGAFKIGSKVFSPSKEDTLEINGKVALVPKQPPKPVRKRMSKKEKQALKRNSKTLEQLNSGNNAKHGDYLSRLLGIKIEYASEKGDEGTSSTQLDEKTHIGYIIYCEYDYSVGSVVSTAVCSVKGILDVIGQSNWFLYLALVEGRFYCPAHFEVLLGNGA